MSHRFNVSCIRSLLTAPALLNISSLYQMDLFLLVELIHTSLSSLLTRALIAGCSVQSLLSLLQSEINHSPNAYVVFVCLLDVSGIPWEEKKRHLLWLLKKCEEMKTECLWSCLCLISDAGLTYEGNNDYSVIEAILNVYLDLWNQLSSQHNSGLFLSLITGSARLVQNIKDIPLILSSETQTRLRTLIQLVLCHFIRVFDAVRESHPTRSRRTDLSSACGEICRSFVASTPCMKVEDGEEATVIHAGVSLSSWFLLHEQKEIGRDIILIACQLAKQSNDTLRLVTFCSFPQLIRISDASLRIRLVNLLCNASSYSGPCVTSSLLPIVCNWSLIEVSREGMLPTTLQERVTKILKGNEENNQNYLFDIYSDEFNMEKLFQKWRNRETFHSYDEWK